MTREAALKHLNAVRDGRFVAKRRINEALRTTGDLPPLFTIVARRRPNFGQRSAHA